MLKYILFGTQSVLHKGEMACAEMFTKAISVYLTNSLISIPGIGIFPVLSHG